MTSLIDVENLTLSFRTDEGLVTAVEDVSFSLKKGEVMGLVGESGSGKELFDVRRDPAEKNNLIATHPAEADKLAAVLQTWQRSVLESLTGADYR